MFYDPVHEHVRDYVGGEEDLGRVAVHVTPFDRLLCGRPDVRRCGEVGLAETEVDGVRSRRLEDFPNSADRDRLYACRKLRHTRSRGGRVNNS